MSPKEKTKTVKKIRCDPSFTCLCCNLNFEILKASIDASLQRGRSGENAQFSEPIILYSRPEFLPCHDCEGLKGRFANYMGSTVEFEKDCHGFIRLSCKTEQALYLLKGTRVLSHYVSPQLQGFIKLS